MTSILCAAVVAVSAVASLLTSQQAGSIRAYIIDETRTGTRPIPGAEGRLAAAQDLANALPLKNAAIRLVTRKDDADLVIEITDRFPKAGSSTGVTAQIASQIPLGNTPELSEHNVEAVVSRGQAKTRFVGSSKTSWKEAAANLAEEIGRWIERNYQKT
jgi:hypothetical protein